MGSAYTIGGNQLGGVNIPVPYRQPHMNPIQAMMMQDRVRGGDSEWITLAMALLQMQAGQQGMVENRRQFDESQRMTRELADYQRRLMQDQMLQQHKEFEATLGQRATESRDSNALLREQLTKQSEQFGQKLAVDWWNQQDANDLMREQLNKGAARDERQDKMQEQIVSLQLGQAKRAEEQSAWERTTARAGVDLANRSAVNQATIRATEAKSTADVMEGVEKAQSASVIGLQDELAELETYFGQGGMTNESTVKGLAALERFKQKASNLYFGEKDPVARGKIAEANYAATSKAIGLLRNSGLDLTSPGADLASGPFAWIGQKLSPVVGAKSGTGEKETLEGQIRDLVSSRDLWARGWKEAPTLGSKTREIASQSATNAAKDARAQQVAQQVRYLAEEMAIDSKYLPSLTTRAYEKALESVTGGAGWTPRKAAEEVVNEWQAKTRPTSTQPAGVPTNPEVTSPVNSSDLDDFRRAMEQDMRTRGY